jgi:4-diphosphocytidyl-2-C-methyl-D-erythritol kinase
MSKTVTVFSPAKVNLYLSIGARRADGYHDATSIMHALSLHDVLRMTVRPANVDDFGLPTSLEEPTDPLGIEVQMSTHGGVAPLEIDEKDNIAYQAVRRFADEFGVGVGEHVRISIEKNIPAAAGLGGGSSNAAAALVGCCNLWDIDVNDERVTKLASDLGADVPFFLHGGCVCMTGRGEVFDHELEPRRATLVVVRPEQGVSTKEAYAAFDSLSDGERPMPTPAMDAGRIAGIERASELPLYNNLAAASEKVLPELVRVRSWLEGRDGITRDPVTGRPEVLLTGSGSATYAVVDSIDAAFGIVSAAKLEGWWARSTSFVPAGARVIE